MLTDHEESVVHSLPSGVQDSVREYIQTIESGEGDGIGRLRLSNTDKKETELSDFILSFNPQANKDAYQENLHAILNA